jgi:hypothetical protein
MHEASEGKWHTCTLLYQVQDSNGVMPSSKATCNIRLPDHFQGVL